MLAAQWKYREDPQVCTRFTRKQLQIWNSWEIWERESIFKWVLQQSIRSCRSLGLNYRDGEKVRIKASLFPLWHSSFWSLPNRSASAGTVPKLTRKWPDFQESGWQRGEDEEHSSPALCYHFPSTNGINRAAQRKASAPVPRQKKHWEETGKHFSSAMHFFSGKYFICGAALICSFPLLSLMWGCLHARSLSAFHGRTEQWKKKSVSMMVLKSLGSNVQVNQIIWLQ